MKVQLLHLVIHTRKTTEHIEFSPAVTFLYGPIGRGKSTVARLIDYCLGGDVERTPAIQQEFVAVELYLVLGEFNCTLERAAVDRQSVRATWSGPHNEAGSVNAPLLAGKEPLLEAEVYNLSDLIFHLCGVTPIKVRQRSKDPDSPLIRLSIRDLWWYCYLEQMHLDSSFFHLEEPFRGRKSQDAMRFFTGLHSERYSQLENELIKTAETQRVKREAVQQIRAFMHRFELGSELDLNDKLQTAERELTQAEQRRTELEHLRLVQVHPTDTLRNDLRQLGAEIGSISQAIADAEEAVAEQKALKAELITAKTKSVRAEQARNILEGAHFQSCPECGANVANRPDSDEICRLCGSVLADNAAENLMKMEVMRRDLNERIDQIADSMNRREGEIDRMRRQLAQTQQRKESLDKQLQEELARYDSAYIESIRGTERDIARLTELIRSLRQLQLMPEAINALEEEADALQGHINRLQTLLSEERNRLRNADENVNAIAEEFKRIMLAVSFPGVSEDDEVMIDPRNWKPTVIHGDQEWTFWDTGSGGKKTLFNVCYALAIHSVALQRKMPVPNLLIIDSPTKNISEDENPELVQSLYEEIYHLARSLNGHRLQFLLIDSDLVTPDIELPDFKDYRIERLIPYYTGP